MSVQKYVFLLGSAKSGTTKLADMLDMHPEISLASTKEPDFFTDRIQQEKSIGWYNSLFNKDAALRLDASTSYTLGWNGSSENIAKRMYDFSPEAQLIYLYRDPAKRAWSSYWHSVRSGSETRSVEEALSDDLSQHIQGSHYHARMNEYVRYFSRDQLHILPFDTFIKCPTAYVNALFIKMEMTTIEYRVYESDKKENESFVWGGPFGFMRHVPLHYLQFANSLVKSIVPNYIHQKIKNLLASQYLPCLNH